MEGYVESIKHMVWKPIFKGFPPKIYCLKPYLAFTSSNYAFIARYVMLTSRPDMQKVKINKFLKYVFTLFFVVKQLQIFYILKNLWKLAVC